jgi:hypothetical protein
VVDKPPQAAPRAPYSGTDVLHGHHINAFLGLLQVWKLAPARGWRMLTGLGYRAGSLTPDQIARVQHLMAIDAGMRTIKGDAVGEWLVARKCIRNGDQHGKSVLGQGRSTWQRASASVITARCSPSPKPKLLTTQAWTMVTARLSYSRRVCRGDSEWP